MRKELAEEEGQTTGGSRTRTGAGLLRGGTFGGGCEGVIWTQRGRVHFESEVSKRMGENVDHTALQVDPLCGTWDAKSKDVSYDDQNY